MDVIEIEKWFIEFHSIIDLYDKIDYVYNTIDNFLLDGKFWLVDIILNELDCSKLSITENLSLLTITFSAKNELNQRNNFYNKVKNYLISIGKSQEKINELLRGLE